MCAFYDDDEGDLDLYLRRNFSWDGSGSNGTLDKEFIEVNINFALNVYVEVKSGYVGVIRPVRL